MVKGYDPTQTDPALILLNSLIQLTQSQSQITLASSHDYLQHWLANSPYTAPLYASFQSLGMAPRVKLIKNCHLSQGQFKDVPDLHFPSTSTQ